MNKYKDYSLKEIINHYLTFLMLWNTGVLYGDRADVHDALFEKLGLKIYERGDEIEANRILHNLDKEIGYVIGIEYDDADIEKLTKKLYNKLTKIYKVK